MPTLEVPNGPLESLVLRKKEKVILRNLSVTKHNGLKLTHWKYRPLARPSRTLARQSRITNKKLNKPATSYSVCRTLQEARNKMDIS